MGVPYHAEKHLFLHQKTYQALFSKFHAIKQTFNENLNMSSKGQILQALEKFMGPFDTPSIQRAHHLVCTTVIVHRVTVFSPTLP